MVSFSEKGDLEKVLEASTHERESYVSAREYVEKQILIIESELAGLEQRLEQLMTLLEQNALNDKERSILNEGLATRENVRMKIRKCVDVLYSIQGKIDMIDGKIAG